MSRRPTGLTPLPLHVPKKDGKRCHHWLVYRLTCSQLDEMLWRAAGRCEICGVRASALHRGTLCIDHDHRLGFGHDHIRGMVCQRCNAALKYVDSGFRRPTQAQQRYIYEAWFWTWLPPDQMDEPYIPSKPQDGGIDASYVESPHYRRRCERGWVSEHYMKQFPPPLPQKRQGRTAVLKWETSD